LESKKAIYKNVRGRSLAAQALDYVVGPAIATKHGLVLRLCGLGALA